jgi:hypothetical protein
MKEFEDFQQSVSNLGTAASDVKAKGIALKAAIDQKIAELGKQVAADTAAPSA